MRLVSGDLTAEWFAMQPKQVTHLKDKQTGLEFVVMRRDDFDRIYEAFVRWLPVSASDER